MKNILRNFIVPAIISSLLTLFFVALEFNRQGFQEGFPAILFALLWCLQSAFIIVLMQIVRSGRNGNSIKSNPLDLLLRVSFLALVSWMWAGILMDQMPCLFGVLNCK